MLIYIPMLLLLSTIDLEALGRNVGVDNVFVIYLCVNCYVSPKKSALHSVIG